MERRDFVFSDVPPHAKMLSDTTLSLMKVMKGSDKLVLMGDFNCKEVFWKEMTTEGGESS